MNGPGLRRIWKFAKYHYAYIQYPHEHTWPHDNHTNIHECSTYLLKSIYISFGGILFYLEWQTNLRLNWLQDLICILISGLRFCGSCLAKCAIYWPAHGDRSAQRIKTRKHRKKSLTLELFGNASSTFVYVSNIIYSGYLRNVGNRLISSALIGSVGWLNFIL